MSSIYRSTIGNCKTEASRNPQEIHGLLSGTPRAKNEYLPIEEFKVFATTCPQDFAVLVRGAVITGCRYMELGRMPASAYDPTNKSVSTVQSKTGRVKHVYLTDEEAIFFEYMAAGKHSADLLFTQLVAEDFPPGTVRP